MPRKKTEPASGETIPVKQNTAKKRSKEPKDKSEAVRKPRKKKETKPEKEEKIETVEAELVQESNKKKHRYGVNNNLIPNSERSPNEARENGRKGGIKSGETRRAKKNLREFGQAFLMQQTSPVFQSLMETHDVDSDDFTNLAALFVRVYNKAMSTGDLNAARQVIEWAGMAPLQEMRENEAIAKMSQVMQLAQGMNEEDDDDNEDVVFYIPENNRAVIRDET